MLAGVSCEMGALSCEAALFLTKPGHGMLRGWGAVFQGTV